MVDKNKFEVGHKKCKSLPAGQHTNMQLLRQALNEICENESIDKPESLEELNNYFN